MRGRADIFRRRGDLTAALTHYRAALALARNDPDLERIVEELSRQAGDVAPPKIERVAPKATPASVKVTPAKATPPNAPPPKLARPVAGPTPLPQPATPPVPEPPKPDPIRERALRTIAALERFLDAVHVVSAQHHA
jgi:hypothetical protein